MAYPAWIRIQIEGIKLPLEGLSMKTLLHDLENMLIDQALARHDGSRTKAAELLGLQRTTLVMKLRKREGRRV